MQYENGGKGWGPEKIHLIFAHETCHIFGAKDEYAGHDEEPSGTLQIPNKNVNGAEKCLMHGENLCELVMCKYTRGQIGWYWNSKEYINENFYLKKILLR